MNKTLLIAILLAVALSQNAREARGPIMGGQTIKVVTKSDISAKVQDIEINAEADTKMTKEEQEAMNIGIKKFNQLSAGKQVLGDLVSYSSQIVAGTKYTFEFLNTDTNVRHKIVMIIKYWLPEGHPDRLSIYFT